MISAPLLDSLPKRLQGSLHPAQLSSCPRALSVGSCYDRRVTQPLHHCLDPFTLLLHLSPLRLSPIWVCSLAVPSHLGLSSLLRVVPQEPGSEGPPVRHLCLLICKVGKVRNMHHKGG